jgi:hypothetical protein
VSHPADAPGARPIRVLLTTQLMSRPGGVAQYLRILRPHLQTNVQYFTIGTRSDDEAGGKISVAADAGGGETAILFT